MAIDTNHFKEKLERELASLEAELKTVGQRNPNNPNDWEPAPEMHDTAEADPNDAADRVEDSEERAAILNDLEIRYNRVKMALARIEAGTYGVCEISGDEIEEDRLEANPAARTCKAHLDQEETLR